MSFSSILCQSRVYMINEDSHHIDASYISYLFKVVNHLRTLERLTGYNDLFTGAVFPHALKGFYWFSLYSRRIETTEQRNRGVSQCRGATFIWLSRSMTLSSPIHNGAWRPLLVKRWLALNQFDLVIILLGLTSLSHWAITIRPFSLELIIIGVWLVRYYNLWVLSNLVLGRSQINGIPKIYRFSHRYSDLRLHLTHESLIKVSDQFFFERFKS